MTAVPNYLRRAPTAFYVLAVISFIVGTVLPLLEFRYGGYSTDFPSGETYGRGILLKFVVRQVADASYLVANGLVIDVLIRIWTGVGNSKSEGGAE